MGTTYWVGRPESNRPSWKELKTALEDVPATREGDVTWGQVMAAEPDWLGLLTAKSDGMGNRQHKKWYVHANWKIKLIAAKLSANGKVQITLPIVVPMGTKGVLITSVQVGDGIPMPMVEDIELGDRGGGHGSFGKAVGAALEILGYGIVPYKAEYWRDGQPPDSSTAQQENRPYSPPQREERAQQNVVADDFAPGAEAGDEESGFVVPEDYDADSHKNGLKPPVPVPADDDLAGARDSATKAVEDHLAKLVLEMVPDGEQRKKLRGRWRFVVEDMLAYWVENKYQVKGKKQDPMFGLTLEQIGAVTVAFAAAVVENDHPIRRKLLGVIMHHVLAAGS